MKNYLFILCLISFGAHAQDTLVFKSGEVKAVKLIELDTTNNLVVYTFESDTFYVRPKNISSSKIHSTHIDNAEETILEMSEEDAKNVHLEHESKPLKYDYNNWSISTSLTSFFHGKMHQSAVFCNNSYVSIEPEVLLSNYFSIKFPVLIGINSPSTQSEDYHNYHSWNFSYIDIYPVKPVFSSPNDDSWKKSHGKNLLFEIGVQPKYFLHGQTVTALYLSPGFHIGLADKFVNSYYYHFDTIQVVDYSAPSGTGVHYKPAWEYSLGTMTSQKSPAMYFRFEALLGININITQYINFSVETGYSSSMIGNSNLEDKVYAKFFTEEYVLSGSKAYDFKNSGVFVCRAHLVVKFRKRNNTN